MILFVLLLGFFIGSFLGVLVDRIPKDQSFIKGRSKCDFCNRELGLLDLIPIFSYLFQKGKCRFCKAKLSLFYPAIEIITGLLFALILINTSFLSPQFFYYLFVVSGLIVVFFTDLKYGIIPDKILFPSLFLVLGYLFFFDNSNILNHILTGFFSFLFLFSISLIFYFLTKKDSMGGGDIKFALLMGLIVGFPNIVVAFYLAFLTGAAYSIILILWKRKSFRKDTIPFGPFLTLATLISIFWGSFLAEKALIFLGI